MGPNGRSEPETSTARGTSIRRRIVLGLRLPKYRTSVQRSQSVSIQEVERIARAHMMTPSRNLETPSVREEHRGTHRRQVSNHAHRLHSKSDQRAPFRVQSQEGRLSML